MAVNFNGWSIERLSASNWLVWSSDISSMLTLRGCGAALKEGRSISAEERQNAAQKSAEALAIIRLTVSTNDKLALKGCETAHEAWELLETRYKDTSKASCLQLKRELANVTMLGDESIDDMAARVRDLMEQLVAAGLDCSEEDAVRAMLGGLPDAYDSLAVGMLTSDDELSFADVLPKLYVVEKRQQRLVSYVAHTSTKKGPKCWRCGKHGHVKANCPRAGAGGGHSDGEEKGPEQQEHCRNSRDPPFSF